MCLGHLEYVAYSGDVVCHSGAGGDTNVVHIYANSGAAYLMLGDYVAVDVVHHGLEGCWRVCEAKVHDHWFEEAVFGLECCFVFVSFSNTYVIVSPSYIQFSVDMCIAQVMYELRYKGEWILVVYGEGVDLSVILYQSQLAVLLSYEEEGRCVE